MRVHLGDVVDNELIVEEVGLQLSILCTHADRNCGPLNLLDTGWVGGSLAKTLGRVEACRKLLHVLGLSRLVHVAKGHVTEKHQASVVSPEQMH